MDIVRQQERIDCLVVNVILNSGLILSLFLDCLYPAKE